MRDRQMSNAAWDAIAVAMMFGMLIASAALAIAILRYV